MGIIEVDNTAKKIRIISSIFYYGHFISEDLRRDAEEEINEMWNQPRALIWLNHYPFLVEFHTEVFLFPDILPSDILSNRNPRNNYIRVEEFAYKHISFVDGLGCNTGYFKLDNLYKGSTTVAHEYGHTLGLPHPHDIDLRGKGRPGIMYPRGTLVDPEFQYEPEKKAGEKGGTMHPKFRKVQENDIQLLNIAEQISNKNLVLGKFSSKYHEAHREN